MRLTVDVNFFDAFEESEHPRTSSGEFTASNSTEAASQLAIHHNIDLANYGQLPAKKVVEVARAIHATHSDLITRFPGIKKLAPYHRVKMVAGALKNGEAAGMHTTASHYESAHTSIPVNLPTIEMPLKAGGWTVTTKHSVPSVYRHELGHYIMNMLMHHARSHTDLPNFLFAKADKDKIKKNLSQYALTNKEEHFAEALAAYTHPDYGKNSTKIDQNLEKIFNRVLRERD